MDGLQHITERLSLRPFRTDDAEALTIVFGDAEVMRFGDGPQDLEWIRRWVAERIETEANEPGRGVWAVIERASDILIGYCGFFRFPDIGGQAEIEIGFRLGRRYWGRGFATEAATAMRDHGFGALGLGRLVCLIDPANTASIRVAEKLGMTFEKGVLMDGYTHPDHLYVAHADG